jgi:hypothetical protein
MNRKTARRLNQPRTGERRRRFYLCMEPTLIYRLQGLAQVRGVSVASLLADGARAELSKVQPEGQP